MPAERLDVNLFERSVIVDPFPLYEEIRSFGRVVRNEALGVWMVTGYDDCLAILSDAGETFAEMNLEPRVFTPEGRNMIQVDGAEHTRLRRASSPFFTRQATASWEQRVDEAVDQVLIPLVEAGSFDIVDFTAIPTIIVAGMMGIPENRYADFQRWSHLLTSSTSYGNEDSEVGDMIEITGREANDYLREEVAQHAKDMPEDLITVMLRMPDMTEADIRSTAMLLMTAGYDTTAKLITNCWRYWTNTPKCVLR